MVLNTANMGVNPAPTYPVNSGLVASPRTPAPVIPQVSSEGITPAPIQQDSQQTGAYADNQFASQVHLGSSSLPNQIPTADQLSAAKTNYQGILKQITALLPGQATSELLGQLDQAEAELGQLLTQFTHYLETHPEAQSEVQTLGQLFQELGPSRKQAESIRDSASLHQLSLLPDPKASKFDGALTDALPAIEAGMLNPKKESVPKGLNDKYYQIGRALAKNDISIEELRHFSLTGKMSEKMQKALNRAQETGSWTALNATQGMLDTRMAVARTQNHQRQQEITQLQSKKAASTDPVEQANLEKDIQELSSVSADLGTQVEQLKKLKTKTINQASAMRIYQGQRNLQGAQHLEEQANKIEAKQPAKAKSLREQAAKLREAGIKALEAEGQSLKTSVDQYKAKDKTPPQWLRNQASDAFDAAAQGYVQKGQSSLAQTPAGQVPEMPDALKPDQGADKAIQIAEIVNPDAVNELDHQALKSHYHGARRSVFAAQTKALKYEEQVTQGIKPGEQALTARKAYFTESYDLLATVEKRIDLLKAKGPLTIPQTQELGQLQQSAGGIHREFAQASHQPTQQQLLLQQTSQQLPELRREASQLETDLKSLDGEIKGADLLIQTQGADSLLGQEAQKLKQNKQKELEQKQARLTELSGAPGQDGLIAGLQKANQVATVTTVVYQEERLAANNGQSNPNDTLLHIQESEKKYEDAAATYKQGLALKPHGNQTTKQAQFQALLQDANSFFLDKAQAHAEFQDMVGTQNQLIEQNKQEKQVLIRKQTFLDTLPTGANNVDEALQSLSAQKAAIRAEYMEYAAMSDMDERPNYGIQSEMSKLAKQEAAIQKQMDVLKAAIPEFKAANKQDVSAALAILDQPSGLLSTAEHREPQLTGLTQPAPRAQLAFEALAEAGFLRKGMPKPTTREERQLQVNLLSQEVSASASVAGIFAAVQPDKSLKALESGRELIQGPLKPALALQIAGLEALRQKSADPSEQAALDQQLEGLNKQADTLSNGLGWASTRFRSEVYSQLKVGEQTGQLDGTHLDKAFAFLKTITADIQDPKLAAAHLKEIKTVERQFAAILTMSETANAQLSKGNQVFNDSLDQIYTSVKQSNDAAISDIIDLGSNVRRLWGGTSMESEMNAQIKGQLDDQATEDNQRLRNFKRGEYAFQEGFAQAIQKGREFEYLGLVLAGQEGVSAKQGEITLRLNQDFLAGVTIPKSPVIQIGNQSYSYDQIDQSAQYSTADFVLGNGSLRGILRVHPALDAFYKGKVFNPEAIQKSMGDKDQAVLTSGADSALTVYGDFAKEWGKTAQQYAIVNTLLETALFVVIPIPLGSVGTAANGVRAGRAAQALARIPGLARSINGISQLARAAGETKTIIRLAEGMAALQKASPVLYRFGAGATKMGALSGGTMLADKYATAAWGSDSALTKFIRVGGNMLDLGAASRIAKFKEFVPKLLMAEGMVAVNLFAVPAVVTDPKQAELVNWLIGATVPAAIGAYSVKKHTHAQSSELTRQLFPESGNDKFQFALEKEMAVFADQSNSKPADPAQFKAYSERLNTVLTEHNISSEMAKAVIESQRTQWAYQSAGFASGNVEVKDASKKLKAPDTAEIRALVNATAGHLIKSGVPAHEAYQRAGLMMATSYDAQAAHLLRDGQTQIPEQDQSLAHAFAQARDQALVEAHANQWVNSFENIPAEVRPKLQEILSQHYQNAVQDSKSAFDSFRQSLISLDVGGKKIPPAELNTLLMVEAQRLVQNGAQDRGHQFQQAGVPVTPEGNYRILLAEAQNLGYPPQDAEQFVHSLLGQIPDFSAERTAKGNDAAQRIQEQVQFFQENLPMFQIENPKLLESAIKNAYEQGLEMDPRAFDSEVTGGGLKADARHQAFVAQIAAILKQQSVPALQGQIGDIQGAKGVSSDIERIATPEGDFYFKSVDANGPNKSRREVLASIGNDLMGMDIIPNTTLKSFNGKVGSAQEAVAPHYLQGSMFPDLRSEVSKPAYQDSLSNLQAFDYIMGTSDRHPGNLFVDPKSGHIVAIDNESALSSTTPVTHPAYFSGGNLPTSYSLQMRQALATLTPEMIHQKMDGLASPAEIDALIVRMNVVKADIQAKHGPAAYILAQHGTDQPQWTAQLKPDVFQSPEGVQNQLQLMGHGGAVFDRLPTFDTLMTQGGRWTGDPKDAIIFQTYGVGGNMLGNIILDGHVKSLSGDHYGSMSYELSDGSMTPRVNDTEIHKHGARKYNQVLQKIKQDQKQGTLGPDALPATLDGSGKNEVSQLARDLAGKKGVDNVSPIMLEETGMLRQAEVIYFGLTGQEGKYPDSVTTAELLAILNNPELLKKTVFFKIDLPPDATPTQTMDYVRNLIKQGKEE